MVGQDGGFIITLFIIYVSFGKCIFYIVVLLVSLLYRIRSLAIVKGGFSFFSSLTSVPKEKLLFDDK